MIVILSMNIIHDTNKTEQFSTNIDKNFNQIGRKHTKF